MEGDRDVLLDIRGPVATITLNRPDSGNALTGGMIARLSEILTSLRAQESVRAIVLTGRGKYFCTGMDVKQGTPLASGKQPLYAVFDELWRFPKPTIAQMNGPALGGGAGLLLCCDIRVASSDAYIAFPEVALGVYPALISAFVIPQLGIARSQHLMLTGVRLPAKDFIASGVATVIVSQAELAGAVSSVAQQLLKNSLSAQTGVKRLMRSVAYGGEDHNDLMTALLSEFRAMMSSKERSFAAKYFAEHRHPPDWNSFYAAAQSKL